MVKVFTSAKKLEEFLDELKPEEIIWKKWPLSDCE
jgi:hypothetical protein